MALTRQGVRMWSCSITHVGVAAELRRERGASLGLLLSTWGELNEFRYLLGFAYRREFPIQGFECRYLNTLLTAICPISESFPVGRKELSLSFSISPESVLAESKMSNPGNSALWQPVEQGDVGPHENKAVVPP